MGGKFLQLTILLAALTCVAIACKRPGKECKTSSDCCYKRCLKTSIFNKKGVCDGPIRYVGKRSISDDDDNPQDINIEDDFNDDAPDAEESFEETRPGLCTPIGARCPPRGRGVCCSGRCRRTGIIGGAVCVRRYVW